MTPTYIQGWFIPSTGPVDPGFGRPGGPVDPGYGRPGWSPVDPGFGGGAPVYPSHGLPGGGHISTGPIYGGGHPGNKPPGRPILPPHADNGLPPGAPVHPWVPGHWEPVDPGWGKPPLWGFFPTDPGFGIPETPPPVVGGGPVVPGNGGGQWVPTDPDYGVDVCNCGKPHPPIWAWIPTAPVLPDNTLPPAPTPKAK